MSRAQQSFPGLEHRVQRGRIQAITAGQVGMQALGQEVQRIQALGPELSSIFPQEHWLLMISCSDHCSMLVTWLAQHVGELPATVSSQHVTLSTRMRQPSCYINYSVP